MQKALDLARKGAGKVAPNPMVGAVLVKKGRIIAQGFHKKFGAPHAEVDCLQKVTKKQIHGATLYVTLEPCCFYGKTPPCTNFLTSKGLDHLVVAMRDPNPKVSGKGIRQLKRAGVEVRVGVLNHDAKLLNKIFEKNIKSQMPYLSIKLGMSLDGKIAPSSGKTGYITSLQSRQDVHRRRAQVDAVLTTSSTVLADDPHLGVRLAKGKDPLRVVIDSHLVTLPSHKVYRNRNVVVAVSLAASSVKIKRFRKKGIEMLFYKGSKVPLKQLLKDLYAKGVCNIMTEAGANLVSSLLHEGLGDELLLYIAPKILFDGLNWAGELRTRTTYRGISLQNVRYQKFDDDILVQGSLI